MKKVKCFLVLLCCYGYGTAQQVITSGGYSEESDFSVNWILGGDLSAIPAYDPDISYSFQEESEMESVMFIRFYPTVVSDFINIEIDQAPYDRIILGFYNDLGILLFNHEVRCLPQVQVNFGNAPNGIYFIKVFIPGKDQPIKVQKIIKSQTN